MRLMNFANLAISACLSFSLAANAAETSRLGHTGFFAKTTPLVPIEFRPLRYAEFVKLPHAAQIQYMNAFQATLLALDAEARANGTQDSASRFLEFWIANAEAEGDGPDFCINLGVVREVADPVTSDCDPGVGPKMHDFDTKDDLSPLGDSATACKGEAKPCSPVFGFDAHGDLFCASTNRTTSCAQHAKAKGTLSFAAVLQACAVNQNPTDDDNKQLDCKKLAAFFDSQSKIVGDHCQSSPTTKACGILREQLKKVQGDLDAQTQITKIDAKAIVEGTDQANQTSTELAGAETPCPPGTVRVPPTSPPAPDTPPALTSSATTSNLGTATPPDPNPASPQGAGTTAPTGTTVATAPAAAAAPTNCTNKDFPSGTVPNLDNIFDYFKTMLPTDSAKAGCAAVTLPNQSILKISGKSGSQTATLLLPSINGKSQAPVALTPDDGTMIGTVAAVLQSDRFKVSDANLFKSYFPTQFLPDAGSVSIGGKAMSTRGWITMNNTRIRYIPAQLDGAKVTEVDLGITLDGGKEQIIPLSTQAPTK